jgi:hypothetical protein
MNNNLVSSTISEKSWMFCVEKLTEILGVYMKLIQTIPLTSSFIHAMGVFFSSPLDPKKYKMTYEEKSTNFSFLESLDQGSLYLCLFKIIMKVQVYF